MTEEEKVSITNGLLSRIPLYGEFEIQFDDIPPLVNDDEIEKVIKKGAENLKNAQRIKNEQEIIQELIFGGFVINRHDIKVEGKLYRQLTDRGRELKELGSFVEYNRVQELKDAKILAKVSRKATEEKRNKYLFCISLSIAISTGLAALYYLLEILRIQYHRGLPWHVFFQ